MNKVRLSFLVIGLVIFIILSVVGLLYGYKVIDSGVVGSGPGGSTSKGFVTLIIPGFIGAFFFFSALFLPDDQFDFF